MTESTAFPKPGGGTWNLDTAHFSGDSSRICHDLMIEGCSAGSGEGFAMMGAPLRRLDAQFVNGRLYFRQTPLVAPESNAPPPPRPALWLATRLIPAFRAAERRAGVAIKERVWNDELDRWNNEWRPHLEELCGGLARVDVTSLDDQELSDHLAECVEAAHYGARLHFRLHVSDLGPIGLLLVRTRDWGLDPVEVMAALAGSSPATNAPGEALAKLRVALRGASVSSLADVRNASPDAAELLDAFMAEFGLRMTTGYDLRALTLAELPSMILAALDPDAALPANAADQAALAGAAAFDALKSQLAAEHHRELDELVSDARALYGLRDENGPLTWEWPVGLIRRALLEAHRRLLAAGKLPDTAGGEADAIFDLAASEVQSLLAGSSAPSIADVTDRVENRRRYAKLEAPPVLGRVVEPPPLDVFPPNLGLLMDVILTVLTMIEHEPPEDASKVQGIGIGSDVYEGRACVVTSSDEALSKLQPGDVLIAPYTVPTFNSVLAMAGAVVVDTGGLLCHAAVIAREYGIAGVVGTGSATSIIPDGAPIRVDPTAGTVELV